MTSHLLYTLAGIALFALSLHGLLVLRHLVRRIIAVNIMGGGVFLVFLGMAARGDGAADPVPQALVITGIVVSFAMTTLALGVLLRLFHETGRLTLDTSRTAVED